MQNATELSTRLFLHFQNKIKRAQQELTDKILLQRLPSNAYIIQVLYDILSGNTLSYHSYSFNNVTLVQISIRIDTRYQNVSTVYTFVSLIEFSIKERRFFFC